MNEKKINIDVEVIKKQKIYEICCVKPSVYEYLCPKKSLNIVNGRV